MKSLLKKLSLGMSAVLMLTLSLFARAEDIDVFVGGTAASGGLPNILVVLDNTANWTRQSQQWPGGVAQGQSEVRAIKTATAGLVDRVNIGLVEYTTRGTATQDGGFVRFDLKLLNAANKAALDEELDDIFDNIGTDQEKRASGTPYGNLMSDVYNYLAGGTQSFSGAGTPATADAAAYTSQYSTFQSPLSAESSCVKNYVIFISNPNQNGPSTDSSDNSNRLMALYDVAATELEVTGLAPDKLAGQLTGNPLPIPLLSTTTSTSVTDIGWTAGLCYTDATACTTAQSATGGLCSGVEGCACSSDTRKQSCHGSSREYLVKQTTTTTTVAETGALDTSKGVSWNLDDWAKFLNLYGVPVSYTDAEGNPQSSRVPVVTYTIDVFNAQQNADHSGLMKSTANVGGGKYFAATNEDAIVNAFDEAVSEILSASSTFAAVALPLSATNRAQHENQVFIGMFRPESDAEPRWFGNLKRYQVALINGRAELADVDMDPAINTLTNFPSECAQSFWTADSGNYWEDKGVNPSPLSSCVSATTSPWSDAPDGPFVEKGGAAQALRNFASAALPDTLDITARNVLTVNGNSLDAFDGDYAGSVGGQSVVDYIRGQETVTLSTTDAVTGTTTEETVTRARSTIHGDVVHSRPLPINFGGTDNITVFYGSNDGLLRAIDSASGRERWSLVAPEHFGKLQRLFDNVPLVAFPNQNLTATPTPQPKGYFFDGSIGSHVVYNTNNEVSTAYIYPTMRRGGRMVYALNVTNPDSPALLWRKGCPELDSDTGCDTGFSGIGQTWSMPKSAYLRGYGSGATPVVIFGGGYDNCEDTDSLTTTCTSSAKGRAIYVVNATNGTLVQAIDATGMGGIAADISLVDIDYDGFTDYAYGVDLSGNVWRVNFVDPSSPETAIASGNWQATKIASTSGGRKFLNAPSVLPYNGKVYLAFGSGNRERPLMDNYPYQQDVDDRYFVFLDYPTDSTTHNLDGTEMHDYTAPTSCDSAGIYANEGDTMRGWYMSLPARGEQVVTTSVIASGVVAFNTYTPGGAQVGMCSRPTGISTSYQVSLFNASGAIGATSDICGGDRSVQVEGGGMPISPTIGTVLAQDPACTGNSCSEIVTFCIGCKGLSPTEIAPKIDQVRARTYWGSDIDR